MQLDYVSCCEVVDAYMPFNTVVPESQGTVGDLTEFRQPLQVQSHLEMPRILVQLGHTQRT